MRSHNDPIELMLAMTITTYYLLLPANIGIDLLAATSCSTVDSIGLLIDCFVLQVTNDTMLRVIMVIVTA